MNKPDQDKENFEFTERWVSAHLPYGLSISTEDLYFDFIDCLIEQERKDEPTISAFRSRINQMDIASSRYVKRRNRKGRLVRVKAWSKVFIEVEADPDRPCVFSKFHDKAMQLLAAGKEKLNWVK